MQTQQEPHVANQKTCGRTPLCHALALPGSERVSTFAPDSFCAADIVSHNSGFLRLVFLFTHLWNFQNLRLTTCDSCSKLTVWFLLRCRERSESQLSSFCVSDQRVGSTRRLKERARYAVRTLSFHYSRAWRRDGNEIINIAWTATGMPILLLSPLLLLWTTETYLAMHGINSGIWSKVRSVECLAIKVPCFTFVLVKLYSQLVN